MGSDEWGGATGLPPGFSVTPFIPGPSGGFPWPSASGGPSPASGQATTSVAPTFRPGGALLFWISLTFAGGFTCLVIFAASLTAEVLVAAILGGSLLFAVWCFLAINKHQLSSFSIGRHGVPTSRNVPVMRRPVKHNDVMPGKRAGLNPELLRRLDNVYGRMKAAGFEAEIKWGCRTLDEQFQLFAHGRSFGRYKSDLEKEVARRHVTAEQAKVWIDFYDPAVEGNKMPNDPSTIVTKTMASEHLKCRAADVIDRRLGYPSDPNHPYWVALKSAAQAEGLEGLAHFADPSHWQLPKQVW